MIHLILLWQFNAGWMVKYISLWNNMVGVASWSKCGYVLYRNLTLAFKFCPFEKLNIVKSWDKGFLFIGNNHVYIVNMLKKKVRVINVTTKDAAYDGTRLYLCNGSLLNGTIQLHFNCNWIVLKNRKLYVFMNHGIAIIRNNKVIKFVKTPSAPKEGDICGYLVAYTDGHQVFLINLTKGIEKMIMNVTGVGEISFSPNCKYLGFTSPYTGYLFIYSVKTSKIIAQKAFLFSPLSKCPLYLPAIALGNRVVYVGGGDGWVQAFAMKGQQH